MYFQTTVMLLFRIIKTKKRDYFETKKDILDIWFNAFFHTFIIFKSITWTHFINNLTLFVLTIKCHEVIWITIYPFEFYKTPARLLTPFHS